MKQTSPNRWKQNNTNIVLWFKQYFIWKHGYITYNLNTQLQDWETS